jgi:hypothetical protein
LMTVPELWVRAWARAWARVGGFAVCGRAARGQPSSLASNVRHCPPHLTLDKF